MKSWKNKFNDLEKLLLTLLGIIILGTLLFVIGAVLHNNIISGIGFTIAMGLIGSVAFWLSGNNI